MKNIFTLLLALASFSAKALDPNHFTITRISAPYFIVDGNSPATLTKAYVGFEVKNNGNSATTYSNLKFTITSISTSVSGQNYALVSPASGIINVGTLAPGQSKVCYYYVSYPASTTPQGTFNIQLSDLTASGKTQSFMIHNRSSISANAGGTATQSITNQDLIGGIIQDDVTYVVGNVQNGDESDFQVAVSSQFDPTKVTLLSTQVISSSVPGIVAGTIDSLYFVTGNGSNGATIVIRWKFRITGYNYTNYLLPCAGATSGSTNYKYALNTSLGQGTAISISSSANPLGISKTSDNVLYGVNSPAVFTVTISNPGAYGVTIDRITDQLPAGFTYLSLHGSSQVTAANSTSVPSPGATGTITFEGGVEGGGNTSYYIAAGGSIILKYNATSSAVSGSNLTTTAKDFIATTEVGSAQNTVSVSSTLPVTLLDFNGIRDQNRVRLTWKTTQEFNLQAFVVERKTNAGFEAVGSVSANGQSMQLRSYQFVDSAAVPENCQYRLRLVDNDAKFAYSRIVALAKGGEPLSIASVYPAPFSDEIHVTVAAAQNQVLTFQLTDLSGRVVRQQQHSCRTGTTHAQIDNLANLCPGTYILRATAAGFNYSVKLVKVQ